MPKKGIFLFSNVLSCLLFFVFPVNHSLESILSVLSLFFLSSYFVFVMDKDFEDALRRPSEKTNNLPFIVAVLSVMREVK